MRLPRLNYRRLALAYANNIGFVEMMQFQDLATPEEKQLMDYFLEKIQDYDSAWELLKQVTHVDLQ